GQAQGDALERAAFGVEEPRAEVGRPAGIQNGSADDIRPLFQREAPRDAVVDDRLSIVVDSDDLTTIDPPYGRGIRADGETHVGPAGGVAVCARVTVITVVAKSAAASASAECHAGRTGFM